jgi:hypothetical protein
MRNIIPVLAAVVIATTGASSAAQAAVIDFGVAALGGTITYSGGGTLDKSSSLDLDNALLIVTNTGAGDQSGLTVFPTGTHNTVLLTHPVNYGSGTGTVNTPIVGGDIFKTWTGFVNGALDNFVETLHTVTEINRNTANAITVTLSGTVTDSQGIFKGTAATLILSANQVGGPGATVSSAITNTSITKGIPEPSTWVMLALGFVGLGYAAIRRSSKDRSAVSV